MNEKKDNGVIPENDEAGLMTHVNGEIISVPSGPLSLEAEVAKVEKNIELFNRIKVASLRLTSPADWVLQQGAPYLMERGAQTVANAWGVDITNVSVDMIWNEDDKGRYYMFVAHGQAYAKRLGRLIEDEGICSQRDKFFGRIEGGWKAIEEVDMVNVRKKAVTNLYNRLIKRVTGLINVTIEDLEAANLNISKITKVEYKEGRKKSEAKLSKEALEKREEIWKMCLELAAGDVDEARAILKKHSSFKGTKGGKSHEYFVEDAKELHTEKWIFSVYGRVKEALEKSSSTEGQID